jgi:hypothetical protein
VRHPWTCRPRVSEGTPLADRRSRTSAMLLPHRSPRFRHRADGPITVGVSGNAQTASTPTPNCSHHFGTWARRPHEVVANALLKRHGRLLAPHGFEKVPGEVGVYCERGDVMLHHSDLWHSAARATEDPPLGVRRHLRGTFLGGRRLEPDERLEPFNKNAAR